MKALDEISGTLERDASGIWTARGAAAADLSFPEGGHDACFDVEDKSFWFLHRTECIALALARFPFEGPLLDIGGGNGAVSRGLIDRGVEAVVLEPGPAGARNAHARGVADVICATLEDAAFAPGSFGAAGLFDVIEHVEDDVGLLRSTHRVLRTGGTLAVTVPAFEWLWSSEDEVAGHYRRYTLSRLGRVLERAQFHVEYMTYFFAPLVPPVFVARSLRHRLGRREESAVNEHAAKQLTPPAPARKALELLLAPERAMIAKGKRVPLGTSCLAIARRA